MMRPIVFGCVDECVLVSCDVETTEEGGNASGFEEECQAVVQCLWVRADADMGGSSIYDGPGVGQCQARGVRARCCD